LEQGEFARTVRHSPPGFMDINAKATRPTTHHLIDGVYRLITFGWLKANPFGFNGQ